MNQLIDLILEDESMPVFFRLLNFILLGGVLTLLLTIMLIIIAKIELIGSLVKQLFCSIIHYIFCIIFFRNKITVKNKLYIYNKKTRELIKKDKIQRIHVDAFPGYYVNVDGENETLLLKID